MNVFTYGSLTLPEVMTLVAGQVCRSRVAVLKEHHCAMLKDKRYPGLIEMAGSEVPGVVYLDIEQKALARLDFFEDDIYERRNVELVCEDGTKLVAYAYLLPIEKVDQLLEKPWDENWFRETHLDDYLLSAKKWMDGFEPPKV